MGCGSCATGSCGTVSTTPNGCQDNGNCGTGGCNKLNSFDWLGNMDLPSHVQFDVVEVKFKGGRKEFFRNVHLLDIEIGDAVVVETQNGHHVGYVSLKGELVRLQMKKKNVANNDKVCSIYRLATEKDLEKHEQVQKRELPTMFRTRQIISELGLKMKLSDVEFQADNTKATFYYSADERVDFRELIKIIAGEFKIRVEMRQISLRQEASRLGGIGSCGRELCCSTWLTDFKTVSTSAARFQNLSLNPNKLSGQCGRLKCCLNYELETYMDALVDIPKLEGPLLSEKGKMNLQKVDIFKKIMWFSLNEESSWFQLTAKQVHEVVAMNKNGEEFDVYSSMESTQLSDNTKSVDDFNTGMTGDIDRLDDKAGGNQKKKKKRKRRKRKNIQAKGGKNNNNQSSKK